MADDQLLTTDTDPSGENEPDRPGASLLPTTTRGWVASLAAMLFFAGAIGYMVGVGTGGAPGRSSVEVGFLQDMITHHEQAVEMANIELGGGTQADVEAFAREILTFQAYEIGVMEGRLTQWGQQPQDRGDTAMAWMDLPLPVDQMPGLASADEMATLARAEGPAVDALFVRLMQDHHRGGIHMAAYAAAESSDPLVRELAARMERNQRIEVEELEQARERAGLNPKPPGYVPADIPADHRAADDGDHAGHP